MDNAWFREVITVGDGENRFEVSIVLPPRVPTLIIIGASHARILSTVNLHNITPNSKQEAKLIECWKTIVFVNIPGAYSEFKPYREEIMAFILSRVYGRFSNPSIQPTNHIMMAWMSFAWDVTKPGVPTASYTKNLLEHANYIHELAHKTTKVQLSMCYMELPLRPRMQFAFMKANCIIREINSIIDPTIAPARIWAKRMKRQHQGESTPVIRKCVIPGKLDHVLAQEHGDGIHLLPEGYLKWMACIVNAVLLGNLDHDAYQDFTAGNVVSIPQSEANFFKTLRQAKDLAEADPSDHQAAVELRRLNDYQVDCNRLDNRYPTIKEVIDISGDNRSTDNRGAGINNRMKECNLGPHRGHGRGGGPWHRGGRHNRWN